MYDFTEQAARHRRRARYSKDDKDEQFDNTIVITSLGTSDNHFDWKAGVDYKFTDTFLGYVSAATGYRPQSFNPRPFQRTQFVQVDGEEAKSYELGFKADLLERRMRMNVAVFYVDYSQRIVPIAGSECLAGPTGNYLFIVPPGTPGAVQDSLGQCSASTRMGRRRPAGHGVAHVLHEHSGRGFGCRARAAVAAGGWADDFGDLRLYRFPGR